VVGLSAPSGKGGVVKSEPLLVDQINACLSQLGRQEAEGVLRQALDLACLHLAANHCSETAEQLWDQFMSMSIRHHERSGGRSVALGQPRQGEG
jgi:hypothetical protein